MPLAPRRPLVRAVTPLAAATVLAGAATALAGGSTPSGGSSTGGSVPPSVFAASASGGNRTWKPEPATYATTTHSDVPVTMADGTVIRVDVIWPATSSGAQARGPFPVLLTQTPYGKNTLGTPSNGNLTGADPWLVERGYIEVVADVRGSGDSTGSFGIFDPAQTSDAVALVHWAAHLPHADGKVGLFGASYLGINQLLTAGAVGKDSPLKAIFPVVAADDIYRDTSFMGGIPDAEFDTLYNNGLIPAVNASNPIIDTAQDPAAAGANAGTEVAHLTNIATYNTAFTAETEAGNAYAYDGSYWQQREPQSVLARVVANGIPAYLVGGEYDLFQRGEPLNFAGLQNAYDGRSATAPMTAGQRVTGRYQLIDGPWTHLVASTTDFDPFELEWFDTWLKGERTGMGQTPTPLHYYDLGTASWAETTTYPFTGAVAHRLYFGPSAGGTDGAASSNDGTLTPTAPTATTSGTDTEVWSPLGSPCNRSTDQWAMGAVIVASTATGLPTEGCITDDRSTEAGPSALTYTTAPLTRPQTIAGPIDATVFASATTTDTEFVVEVEDVSPSGVATPLTEGALLGQFRAVERARSITAPGGAYLLPYHPYTQASVQPVTPGRMTRYDIEVFPTYATIAAGNRIRVTLSTVDSPHLEPTLTELPALVGGVYTVARTPAAASYLELPLAPARG